MQTPKLNRVLELKDVVGTVAELIYMDGGGRITQRYVVIREASESMIKVFCLQRNQPRSMRKDRILAIRHVKRNA